MDQQQRNIETIPDSAVSEEAQNNGSELSDDLSVLSLQTQPSWAEMCPPMLEWHHPQMMWPPMHVMSPPFIPHILPAPPVRYVYEPPCEQIPVHDQDENSAYLSQLYGDAISDPRNTNLSFGFINSDIKPKAYWMRTIERCLDVQVNDTRMDTPHFRFIRFQARKKNQVTKYVIYVPEEKEDHVTIGLIRHVMLNGIAPLQRQGNRNYDKTVVDFNICINGYEIKNVKDSYLDSEAS